MGLSPSDTDVLIMRLTPSEIEVVRKSLTTLHLYTVSPFCPLLPHVGQRVRPVGTPTSATGTLPVRGHTLPDRLVPVGHHKSRVLLQYFMCRYSL